MKNEAPLRIQDFRLYTKEPNAISYGYLYTKKYFVKDFIIEQNRMVRVWLPGDYFEHLDKTYPVLYMFDGQNMVDEYTTRYGEWDIDTRVHELMKDGKLNGLILVGIDCPHSKNGQYRMQELCPPFYSELSHPLTRKNVIPTGNVIVDYIVEHIKPEIDRTFRVSKKREETGIGGSSMGGLNSFYGGLKYRHIFGYILSFSPAFFLFKKKSLIDTIQNWNYEEQEKSKIYFFVGGSGFEKRFVKPTFLVYNLLKNKGFDNEHIALKHDKELGHHESSWSKEFNRAILFLLKKDEKH